MTESLLRLSKNPSTIAPRKFPDEVQCFYCVSRVAYLYTYSTIPSPTGRRRSHMHKITMSVTICIIGLLISGRGFGESVPAAQQCLEQINEKVKICDAKPIQLAAKNDLLCSHSRERCFNQLNSCFNSCSRGAGSQVCGQVPKAECQQCRDRCQAQDRDFCQKQVQTDCQ